MKAVLNVPLVSQYADRNGKAYEVKGYSFVKGQKAFDLENVNEGYVTSFFLNEISEFICDKFETDMLMRFHGAVRFYSNRENANEVTIGYTENAALACFCYLSNDENGHTIYRVVLWNR